MINTVKGERYGATLALAVAALCASVVGQAQAATDLFATEVREVRASSFNGQKVLSVGLKDVAGPADCRSSTVMLRTDSPASEPNSERLEAIALQSFLSSERVIISVSTDLDGCIDGMPTLNGIWLLGAAETAP